MKTTAPVPDGTVLSNEVKSTTEYAAIKLKVLRSPLDGDITCRTAEECCKFYRTIRWGQSEICNYTDKLIEHKVSAEGVPDLGHTVVTEGCPMKNKEVSL